MQHAILDREAHILGLEAVELGFAEHAVTQLGRSLAINVPGPRTMNRLAVHVHPGGNARDDLLLLAVDRPVAAHRNREEQVAVLRYDVA